MSFKMHFKWSFAFIWLISNLFRVNIPSFVSPQSDGRGCDSWLASEMASFPWPCRRGTLLFPTFLDLSFGGCISMEVVIFKLSVDVAFTFFALCLGVVLWFNASLMKRTKNGDEESTWPWFVRFISEIVYVIVAFSFKWNKFYVLILWSL